MKAGNQKTPLRDLLEKKAKMITALYNNVYDWRPWFEAFSQGLALQSVILDLGCGEGFFLNSILNEHRSWFGVGIDFYRKSVYIGAEEARAQNLRSRSDFILADVNHLPFVADAFFGALVVDVIHHLSSFSSVTELHRTLKTQGKLLIIDQPMEHPLKFLGRKAAQWLGTRSYTFGRPFLFFCAHRLEGVLEKNGFVVLEKEFQEYLFSFLYFMALVPDTMFRALMRLLSIRVLRALSTIEECLGKLPLINALGAHVFLLCYKKN